MTTYTINVAKLISAGSNTHYQHHFRVVKDANSEAQQDAAIAIAKELRAAYPRPTFDVIIMREESTGGYVHF